MVTLTNRKDAKKFLDGIQGKTRAQLAALCPASSAVDGDDATEMPKKTKVIRNVLPPISMNSYSIFITF